MWTTTPPSKVSRRACGGFLVHAHNFAESISCPRQSRTYCPEWDLQYFSNIVVLQFFQANQQQDLSLLFGQAADCAVKIEQLHRISGVLVDWQHRGYLLDRDNGAVERDATHFINVQVMQDREQPRSQVSPLLPQMLLSDSADKATLHQVVGARRITGQGARVTPQAGDQRF